MSGEAVLFASRSSELGRLLPLRHVRVGTLNALCEAVLSLDPAPLVIVDLDLLSDVSREEVDTIKEALLGLTVVAITDRLHDRDFANVRAAFLLGARDVVPLRQVTTAHAISYFASAKEGAEMVDESAQYGTEFPLEVLVIEDTDGDYELERQALDLLPIPVRVTRAADYDTAREELITNHYDFVVLDLLLNGEPSADVDQWQGLWVLWDISEIGLQADLPVVVVTAFDRSELARLAFVKYRILDFISKRVSTADSLAADFDAALRSINYGGRRCRIQLSPALGSWADLTRFGYARHLRSLSSRISPAVAELELRSLVGRIVSVFAEAGLHLISSQQGFSGSAVLRVERRFSSGERGSDVIVKFGDVNDIERERAGWAEIAPFSAGTRTTAIDKFVRGIGLGALEYRLVGGTGGGARSFGEFYGLHSVVDVCSLLTALFEETCSLWYAAENRRVDPDLRLFDRYCEDLDIDLDRLVRGYEFRFGRRLGRERSGVSISGRRWQVPDPVEILSSGELDVAASSWTCRTHGDLHGDNVLVAGVSEPWLIDFGRTGFGHWARDFAVLENFIRFRLVLSSDMEELAEMERALLLAGALDGSVDWSGIADGSVRKAGEAIAHLRRLAAKMTEPYDALIGFAEYVFGVYMASMKYFELQRLLDRKWRKNHVLLVGGVLAQWLLGNIGRFGEPSGSGS